MHDDPDGTPRAKGFTPVVFTGGRSSEFRKLGAAPTPPSEAQTPPESEPVDVDTLIAELSLIHI